MVIALVLRRLLCRPIQSHYRGNVFTGSPPISTLNSPASTSRDKNHKTNLLFRLLSLAPRGNVRPVVLSLDLPDDLLHFPALLLPLGLGHVLRLVEHALIRLAVAAAQAVPEGGVLAVVVVEGQVVDAVAGGAVDDGVVRHELAVVDQDGPEVDKDEQEDVAHLLQGEEQGEDVVGEGLGEAVERVEGVGGVRGGHDPLVVRLVQVSVDQRVVQPAVNPVDAEVGEENEEGILEPVVGGEGGLVGAVVELGVAADLEKHHEHGQDGHGGHGDHGLLDLKFDLVAEVFRVFECLLVEDEDVRQRRQEKVEEDSEHPIKSKRHVSAALVRKAMS